jgi:hypothetical protein
MKNLIIAVALIVHSGSAWAAFPAGWFYCGDDQFFATGRFSFDSCPSTGTGSIFVNSPTKVGSSKLYLTYKDSGSPEIAAILFKGPNQNEGGGMLQGEMDFNLKNRTVNVTLDGTRREYRCQEVALSSLESESTCSHSVRAADEAHQCPPGKMWICDPMCSTNCSCRVIF